MWGRDVSCAASFASVGEDEDLPEGLHAESLATTVGIRCWRAFSGIDVDGRTVTMTSVGVEVATLTDVDFVVSGVNFAVSGVGFAVSGVGFAVSDVAASVAVVVSG